MSRTTMSMFLGVIGATTVAGSVVMGCGGPEGAGDAGPALDTNGTRVVDAMPGADAPGLDAPGLDAPGLDAPGLDAPGLDAPVSPGTDAWVMPTARMEVRLDRPIVESDDEQLTRVTITCVAHDAAGFALPEPADLVVRIEPAGGVEVEPSSRQYTFAARGSHVVTCASSSLGLTGSERLEVAHEGIDRNVVRLTEHAAHLEHALADALAAAQAGDESEVRLRATEVESIATLLPEAPFTDTHLLVPMPGGWPTAEAARVAGLGGGADDAAWASAIVELEAAVRAERDALALLPTTGELTDATAAPYLAASARVHAAARALEPLEPSAEAMIVSMPSLDRLVSDALPGAVREASIYFGEVLQTARVVPPESRGLTLVEAVVSVAVNTVLSEYSYTGVLRQLGGIALDNLSAFVIAGLIDDMLPPDAGAPTILSTHGPAAAFVGAGRAWTARGELWTTTDLDDYAVIFIHPEISGILSDVLELFDSARTALDGDNPIQIAKNIYDIIRSFRALAASVEGVTDEGRLVLYPESISEGLPDEYFVEFPALPSGVNCSFLPRVGTMIPVSRTRGRGPSYMTNVYQETCP